MREVTAKDLNEVTRRIKSNQPSEEQQLIISYVRYKLNFALDRLAFSNDTSEMQRCQGAVRELTDLLKTLGDK